MRRFFAWTIVLGFAAPAFALDIIVSPRHWIPSAFFGVPCIVGGYLWDHRRMIAAAALTIVVFILTSMLIGEDSIQIGLGAVALTMLGIVGLGISSVRSSERAIRLELENRARELAIEHSRLQAALSVSQVVLFSQDRDLRFNWVGRLIWQSESDVIGKTDYDLLSTQDANLMAGLKRRVVREGKGIQQDVCITIDGRDRYLNVSIEPLREEHKRIVGVIVAAVDVSEVHRLLDAEQAARQDAEAARSLLQEFSASIAHDIRQPLTVIVGGIQMLRQNRTRPERQDRVIDLMSASAQQMDRLLYDLQDAGASSDSEYRIVPQPTDFGHLAQSVVAGLILGSPRVSIDVAVAPHLVGYWDPDRITQLLTNLVTNAIKFSPIGGKIQISAAHDGHLCRCFVSDQGPGIPAENRQRVFEPFLRLAATRSVPGTGLGLFICRKIVEMHGGEIWVEDNPDGPGARVIFTLPMSSDRESPR